MTDGIPAQSCGLLPPGRLGLNKINRVRGELKKTRSNKRRFRGTQPFLLLHRALQPGL